MMIQHGADWLLAAGLTVLLSGYAYLLTVYEARMADRKARKTPGSPAAHRAGPTEQIVPGRWLAREALYR